MGQILQFPRNNREMTKPLTTNDLAESIEQFRMSYIDDISDFLLNVVVFEMSRAGFELNDNDTDDVMLIVESIRSAMMKKSGFEHPLQEIAKDIESISVPLEEEDID